MIPRAPLLAFLLTLGTLAVTASAATASAVHGTVSDPDGRPVPGATVHLASLTGTRSTTTDAEGRFRFESLPAGRYRVIVDREGFRADPRPLALADDDLNVPIVLQLSALSETVVVSAAQAERPLSSSPASVTVVSDAELAAQQVDTLADALRPVPGLAVTQSGSRGALTSVFPRGGESDYTLVMLDGVRLNTFGGGLDFANLAEANVERIEIVRGPQSALFGADAVGGVVHVITRRGGPARGTALAEGGSQATTHLAASGAGSLRRWSYGAGGEWLISDGLNGERTSSGEVVGNDDFDRRAASGSAAYAADAVQVRGTFHAGRTERGFPGPFGSDPNGTYPGIDLVSRGVNDWRGASLAADVAVAGRTTLRTSGTWADIDGRFTSPFGTSETRTRRATARLQADVALNHRASLSAGAEILDEEARSTFITGETFEPIPVDRSMLGSFGELRIEPNDRLSLTAGVRVERIHRDVLEADPNPFAPRPPLPSDTVVSANPRIAASWFLLSDRGTAHGSSWTSGWTRVHASAGTGIRPPDAFEIAFTDNPGLQPERSRSVDAGIEQAFARGAAVVDATFFLNRYDDLIVAVGRSFVDASQYRTDNISNARAAGIELAVSGRLGARLELRGAYTLLDTEVLAVDGHSGLAPPPFHVGDPLIRRPRHRGTAQAVLTLARWSAFGRVEARGQVLDVDPTLGAFGGTVSGPGYATVDVGGALRAWRATELIARVTNLLDRRYEEAVGFPAVGRAFMAGIRVAPGR